MKLRYSLFPRTKKSARDDELQAREELVASKEHELNQKAKELAEREVALNEREAKLNWGEWFSGLGDWLWIGTKTYGNEFNKQLAKNHADAWSKPRGTEGSEGKSAADVAKS